LNEVVELQKWWSISASYKHA